MGNLESENDLFNCIPAFKDYIAKKGIIVEEGIYNYLSDFGIFLRDSIHEGETLAVIQSFDLINKWLSLNDVDLDNKIHICIFEILTDTEDSQRAAFEKLSQKGIAIFNSLFNNFNKLV